jgi:hypothetical protein
MTYRALHCRTVEGWGAFRGRAARLIGAGRRRSPTSSAVDIAVRKGGLESCRRSMTHVMGQAPEAV